jgi:elongation factor Ts
MKVDINLVKQLRDATMASLAECKKALEEASGDLDNAIKILREKGALKAAKKADRETHEGAVMAKKYDNAIVGVTLYCETDFVAKNDNFVSLVEKLLDIIAPAPASDSFDALPSDIQDALNSTIEENILTLGENLKLGPLFVAKENGYVYNHTGNKITAIVFGDGNDEIFKEVALQITAMNPQYLDRNAVPQATIDELISQATKELEGDNKPADIKEKIIAGKISKALEDVVLIEQIYIRDGSKKIKDILGGSTIDHFVRMSI